MELIDLNGMYQWDNTIFDNMVIPSDINRNELIDMLILDCRELTISIVSPTILKRAIELWSKKNIYYWEELQKTMHYDYNPIENYDRHETSKDTFNSTNEQHETGDRKTKQSGTNTTTETGTKTTVDSGSKTTTLSGSKTTTDELEVSAFNDGLKPREKHTITETPNSYTTTETPNALTSTETPNLTTTNTPNIETVETPNIRVNDRNNGTNIHESRIRGNVGVTTSQQMILSQREVIDISLYNVIINSFKNEFCLLKY